MNFSIKELKLISLCLIIFSSGCHLSDPADANTRVEPAGGADEISKLAPDLNQIDMNAFTGMMCEQKADCIAKESAHFITPQKRKELDEATMKNLLRAAKEGIAPERIKAAVYAAKRVSYKLENVTSVTLIDHTTKDAVALLVCMSQGGASGALKNESCFAGLLKAQ